MQLIDKAARENGQEEGRGAGSSDSYPMHFVAILGPSNELRALETLTIGLQNKN